MHNGLMHSEIELGNFGEYLLKRRIVAEKHAPFYVKWVRRFLAGACQFARGCISVRFELRRQAAAVHSGFATKRNGSSLPN